MINDQLNPKPQNPKREYNLGERTAKFSEVLIDFLKGIGQDALTKPLINQLVRAGTSIGANYTEAEEASSKRDFVNKIAIANKEARETKYWLRIVAHTLPSCKQQARMLWKEAQELNLIFAAIIRSAKKK